MTTEEILDAIAKMSVLEVSELVKAMEEKFGVTAAAPVAMAAAPAAGGAAAGGDAADAKDEFDVVLKGLSDESKKIAVIKEVRGITGLGLKEAKEAVESGDKVLKEGLSKEEADKMKTALEAAGAKIEIA